MVLPPLISIVVIIFMVRVDCFILLLLYSLNKRYAKRGTPCQHLFFVPLSFVVVVAISSSLRIYLNYAHTTTVRRVYNVSGIF